MQTGNDSFNPKEMNATDYIMRRAHTHTHADRPKHALCCCLSQRYRTEMSDERISSRSPPPAGRHTCMTIASGSRKAATLLRFCHSCSRQINNQLCTGSHQGRLCSLRHNICAEAVPLHDALQKRGSSSAFPSHTVFFH